MNGNLDLEFRKHLCEHDSVFLKVIEKHPPLELPSARPPFEALARIVAGQQLSVKAAATLFQRLELALNGKVTANAVAEASIETLRDAGLSRAKGQTLMALAAFTGADEMQLQSLVDGPWSTCRAQLLHVKGIGPWSVDMFAMFGIGNPDIFASGDLGLRVAMERHLDISPKQKPAVYDQRALVWSPFRTLASLHLWHSLKPDHERFVV